MAGSSGSEVPDAEEVGVTGVGPVLATSSISAAPVVRDWRERDVDPPSPLCIPSDKAHAC